MSDQKPLPGYTGRIATTAVPDPYEEYKQHMAELSTSLRGNIFGPAVFETPTQSSTVQNLAFVIYSPVHYFLKRCSQTNKLAVTSNAYQPDATFHSKTSLEKQFVEAELTRRNLEARRKANLAAPK